MLGVWLLARAAHHPPEGPNYRYERLERLGAEARGDFVADGNSIVLSSSSVDRPVSAEWDVDRYEWSHVLPRADRCAMSLYVMGLDLTAQARGASARLDVDGYRVRTVRFGRSSDESSGELGLEGPIDLPIRAVRFSPIFEPLVYEVALPAAACRQSHWTAKITVSGARWAIDRVGFVAGFVPGEPRRGGAFVAICMLAAALVIVALLALAAALEAARRRAGILGLVVATAIVGLSLVTYDEWDFHVWQRFVDLIAFGGGDPANMWPGTPLWAVLPGVVAPVLIASYGLFGDGSSELCALGLKMLLAIAFVGNASIVSSLAPVRFRRWIFGVALLAPVGLYELAGGYRETLAATFAALGFVALRDRRRAAGAALFALGASISESLIPLLALPSALALVDDGRLGKRMRPAIAYATLGVAIVVAQFVLLTPHGFAGQAIATRVLAYRYGGASWFSVADAFRVLPPWVGPHSFAVVGTIFVVLGIAVVVPAVVAIRREALSAERERRATFALVGIVAVLFLAYRGIDPNDWYALFITALCYFAWYRPASPVPLFLGSLMGLAFYTIVGVGDFVSWSYFMPSLNGVLGTLTHSSDVMTGAVNVALLALAGASATGEARLLFGRGSVPIAVVSVCGIAAAASADDAPDAVIVAAATIIAVWAYARSLRLLRLREDRVRDGVAVFSAVLCLLFAVVFGHVNGLAALVAMLGFGIAIVRGIGLYDLVLVGTACALLAVNSSFGWYSIAGYTGLSLCVLACVAYVYRAARPLRAISVDEAPGPRLRP